MSLNDKHPSLKTWKVILTERLSASFEYQKIEIWVWLSSGRRISCSFVGIAHSCLNLNAAASFQWPFFTQEALSLPFTLLRDLYSKWLADLLYSRLIAIWVFGLTQELQVCNLPEFMRKLKSVLLKLSEMMSWRTTNDQPANCVSEPIAESWLCLHLFRFIKQNTNTVELERNVFWDV